MVLNAHYIRNDNPVIQWAVRQQSHLYTTGLCKAPEVLFLLIIQICWTSFWSCSCCQSRHNGKLCMCRVPVQQSLDTAGLYNCITAAKGFCAPQATWNHSTSGQVFCWSLPLKLDILWRTLKTSSLHPKKESLWKHLSMSLICLCMKTWVLAGMTLDKDHSNLNLNNKLAWNNALPSVVCYTYQLSCLLNITILCTSGSPGLLSTFTKLFNCEVTGFFACFGLKHWLSY